MKVGDWAGRLTEDYIKYFMPVLIDEEKWQEWGNIVAGTDPFRAAKVPSPSMTNPATEGNAKTWQDWAKAFYATMANHQGGQ